MLKVGDILWVFGETSYEIYEISTIMCYNDPAYHETFCYIGTSSIISDYNQHFLIPARNYNNLVKLRHHHVTRYYTISEKEAVKFIESHYND